MLKVKKNWFVILLVAVVLLLDQILKVWVKTNMKLGEEINILGLSWAILHFVENNGMAFGISLGDGLGKISLSLFRVLAVGFLVYYIHHLLKANVSYGLLLSFALILAGAMGNIIDSAFYGMIFSESGYHATATAFPPGGGYAPFLRGRVVDMFYFPLVSGFYPEWVPGLAGKSFTFFKPVFNVADSAITIGVLNILLFQRKFFTHEHKPTLTEPLAPKEEETNNTTPPAEPVNNNLAEEP